MKKQRAHYKMTAFLIFALFAGLAVYGGWSVFHYGSRWFSYAPNPRLIAQQRSVTKGDILDRKGTVLAQTLDGRRVFQSSSEARSAVVHLVGDRRGMIANSVDSFQAGYLYGVQPSLADAIRQLTSPSPERKGNTITLTVDASLCAKIPSWFRSHVLSRDKNGAAVVLNYRTGELLAEVSLPCFDPDHADEASLAALDHPYWNRVTQGLYPPGSTFKIVTAAASLERINDAADRTFTCTGSLPVTDSFSVRDFNNSAHGQVKLREAFLHSCNSVFAALALEMGDSALRASAERFGFNQNFLFRDLVVYNSSYPTHDRTREAVAASGYGQSALTLTPMHLCLIGAAVANNGVMPEPRLLRLVKTSSGTTVLRFTSASVRRVCREDTARQLKAMMKDVIQSGGSGSQASVSQMDVHGKTGTAESTLNGAAVNYGWFVGFSGREDLPVAVCVLVEGIPDGETGGTVAAPIARDILTYIRNHPEVLE